MCGRARSAARGSQMTQIKHFKQKKKNNKKHKDDRSEQDRDVLIIQKGLTSRHYFSLLKWHSAGATFDHLQMISCCCSSHYLDAAEL